MRGRCSRDVLASLDGTSTTLRHSNPNSPLLNLTEERAARLPLTEFTLPDDVWTSGVVRRLVNGKHDVRGVDYWGAAENTSLNLTTWKRYMRMTLIHLTYKSTMMTPPTYDPPSQG